MDAVRNVLKCFIFALAFLPCIASKSFAEDGISNRLQKPQNGITQWHIGAGYFVPNEGDLNGGPIVGLGFKYTLDKDTVFGDFFYSPTSQNVTRPSFKGDVKNYQTEFGYMTNFGKHKKPRLGGGLQIHQMELGSSNRKRTSITVFGLAEYDLSSRWTIRVQSSQVTRNRNIRFGGLDIKIFMNY